MKKLIVTGAAGFIGSNFVRRALAARADWSIVGFDALSYAGNLRNLDELPAKDRFEFVRGDICDAPAVGAIASTDVWGIVNFAAESHVDRSLHGGAEFVRTNVLGTQVLLQAVREFGVERYLQVSTDEVYGSLGPVGRFTEQSPLAPNSPYSASKAGADLLARSYYETFGTPVIVSRCSNNYGPFQFPEKVIPLFITNLLEERQVPLYGDGLNIRDWIHVTDHCEALLAILERGRPGGIYNVGGGQELTNLELTHMLLREVGRDESFIRHVADRLGHDRRYAIDFSRVTDELGWRPQIPFIDGLQQTIRWYRENESWWQEVKSGEYREYYDRQYGATLAAGRVSEGEV